ncbi:hypothetical protein [Pseudochelatococcus sp. G4_1912]|uniref:hypothetical protein n=1 Tax=Pseudochelatococcus sp. G4_1912 TaxID=3114288 RepID=UPI0039C66319
MRRPSRSFTVEVKRSRLRAGDPSIASALGTQRELPQAAVASALSWEELLRRLPENMASKTDQPFLASWPGLEDEAQPDIAPKSEPEKVSQESGQPDTEQKPRVLPSLLIPAEIPLTERKSVVYSRTSDPWSTPRSRLPKQTEKPQTTELHAAGSSPSGAGSQPLSTDVQKRVQARLRQLAAEARARAGGETVQETQPGRPASKRRRQDFWKHRLRSYAARD